VALLTDNVQVTLADLRTLEPEVAQMSEESEIVLDGPLGIIRDAWDQCADQLVARSTGYGGMPDLDLANIVATDPLAKLSSLQRWIAYQALVLFFRAATARTINDRYQRKLDLYETALAQAWSRLRATGLLTILNPLPCPAAAMLRGSGNWDDADITDVAGGSGQATTYDLAITAVDTSKPTVVESGPSHVVTYDLPAARTLLISIERVNWVVPAARAKDIFFNLGYTPAPTLSSARATGWNIYAGPAGGTLRLQTASPVPSDTKVYELPAPPFPTSGRALGTGQMADGVYQFPNIVHRG
jgi:hypothetical protein